MKPNHKGTAQIFENPYLERLTKTHIAVPISIFIIIAIGLIIYGFMNGFLNVLSALGLFIVGWLIFFCSTSASFDNPDLTRPAEPGIMPRQFKLGE